MAEFSKKTLKLVKEGKVECQGWPRSITTWTSPETEFSHVKFTLTAYFLTEGLIIMNYGNRLMSRT